MGPTALLLACLAASLAAGQDAAQSLSSLPILDRGRKDVDWLVETDPTPAGAFRSEDGRELILDNGLIRRAFRLRPALACVAFDDLRTGASLLRAVRPEARLTIDGLEFDVGGLLGQPNHAYLDPRWLEEMRPDPRALRLVGFEVGPTRERFPWKRVRRSAQDVEWPPSGVSLRLDFALPELAPQEVQAADTESGTGRQVLFEEEFDELDEGWRVHTSLAHERSSFLNEGKLGEIYTPANTAVFAQRALPAGARVVEVGLHLGTDRSASWGPGMALVWPERTLKLNLRASTGGDGGAIFGVFDGAREHPRAGGHEKLDVSAEWTLRMVLDDVQVHLEARSGSGPWLQVARVERPAGDPTALRVGKLDVRGEGSDHSAVGELMRSRILSAAAFGDLDAAGLAAAEERAAQLARLSVSVHYELYDGLPLISKWVTVDNHTQHTLTIDRCTSEILAAVEGESRVDSRDIPMRLPPIHVETDYAMGGMMPKTAVRHAVHWKVDPRYTSQVSYRRRTPCLLEVHPASGPCADLPPGERFESVRVFELPFDSDDVTRRSLSLARAYRAIAPWVTENPLMMHVRHADRETVQAAIDQCAEVGFEMVILTFGSGFNIEDTRAENLERMASYADYADERGIEIGGYSLLSSRRIQPDSDNCVNPATGAPGGQTHGFCPALASVWGQRYFATLRAFFDATGFDLLEHDGPYPGDQDASARPPLQKGVEDSRWVQWHIASDFYRWCRGRGIFLNTPDWYFLSGSNKTGMGYREVNWSLPRAQQVIHTRQNIFDGTRYKLPSMGWMFVPLTQYHGGGAAATVEPLDEHLDHYERMLMSNLGAGVQACYRGPRLYDTERTREVVARWVSWYKAHRDILESPIAHSSSRRADGRGLDWLLHVNPALEERGMLVVYNPLERALEETLDVDLYYTGATEEVELTGADGALQRLPLTRDYRARVEVSVPAGGMRWFSIR